MSDLYNQLSAQVEYAKTSIFPIRQLYYVHGLVTMARKLGAITADEYFELEHECIYKGINNPEIILKDKED